MKHNYSIGDVAKRFNRTTRTLRFYEDEGLIRANRTAKGTRYYTDEHLDRFKAIILLIDLGISIKDIAYLSKIRENSSTGNVASHYVYSKLDDFQKKTEENIEIFQRALREVENAKRLVAQCFECERSPNRNECDICPISDQLYLSSIMPIIWDQ